MNRDVDENSDQALFWCMYETTVSRNNPNWITLENMLIRISINHDWKLLDTENIVSSSDHVPGYRVQYSLSSSHTMPHVKHPSYVTAQVRLLFSLFTLVFHSCCRARTSSFEKQTQDIRYPTSSSEPYARVLSMFLHTNYHSSRIPLRHYNDRTLFRRDANKRGSLPGWSGKNVMHVAREESDGGARRRGRRVRRPLLTLCEGINSALLEICVVNKGRPLAAAITDFVERTIEAFISEYSIDAVVLELQMLDGADWIPGETLTGAEKLYRMRWLWALHVVLQRLGFVEPREARSLEEEQLRSQVEVVLRGRQTRDEQIYVKFDKALASRGVTGGVAKEAIVIPPQLVPISQLVLLAIRTLQKMKDDL